MTSETLFPQARLLLIDDEAANLLLLERILQKAGYRFIQSTTDPREALALFDTFQPDLICTDLHMTPLSGIQVMRQILQRVPADAYLPIIMLTADHHPDAEQEALSEGAKDFINKPFRAVQIILRVHNQLQTRFLHLALQAQNAQLELRVRERTIELELARTDALERLALAAEYRDYTTGQHTQRVGQLSAQLAAQLKLDAKMVDLIRRAAPLHDVGKIGIPDDILLKPARLNDHEYALMKTHVDFGAKLLANSQSELVQLAELIALTHHERWDGSGYPRGLKAEEIPLVGQIVAVADVFDTLIHHRPYKRAWPVSEAVGEILRLRGQWFAPHVVDAFIAVIAQHYPGVATAYHNSDTPG
jgi:putative two-component system response regulator